MRQLEFGWRDQGDAESDDVELSRHDAGIHNETLAPLADVDELKKKYRLSAGEAFGLRVAIIAAHYAAGTGTFDLDASQIQDETGGAAIAGALAMGALEELRQQGIDPARALERVGRRIEEVREKKAAERAAAKRP